MLEPDIITLSNGIRVAYRNSGLSRIVHCGIMFDIGSRDESPDNQGIAHFWEHMAFKGTRTRSAFHILNRLESVGGELNAFTDKEKIMFYASVRTEHFTRAAELITDIAFHSIFPEKQIRRESRVILEEMTMYYDDPDGALQDEFDSLLFGRHPLGMNILGTARTVSSFRRRDFIDFIRKNMDTRRIVFSVMGDVPRTDLDRFIRKSLEPLAERKVRRTRKPFLRYNPQTAALKRPVKQARCALGRPAFSIHDDRRIPLYFLNNILGGPGMNSRLNLTLREKHGYVYSIGSQYIPFSDTGLFVVSFGTDPGQLDRAIRLTRAEMARLMDKPMSQRQLKVAREQFLGQMAMAEENHIGFMMVMARNILDTGTVFSFDAICERISSVTAADLQAVAAEVFDPEGLSTLVLEPQPAH